MKRFFGLKSDHSSQSNDYHRQPQTHSQPSYQQPTQSATTRFRAIRDRFTNLEEVQHELRRNGLESSNLIVGLDFTKSNEWTGKYSFQGRSLHAVTPSGNPYEEVTGVIGRTLF
ncbi:hypothetical protein WJX84_007274 [Apatococcus fuscideae]|uniref:Uncharacterized protein n=1 Tax=Apatococcus fuscideae TaxID=2026836 RepID=A0AAW1SJU8_9CHLO